MDCAMLLPNSRWTVISQNMFYLLQTWTFITKTNGEVVDKISLMLSSRKLMLEAKNIFLQSQFPATCVGLGGIYGPDRLWLINYLG